MTGNQYMKKVRRIKRDFSREHLLQSTPRMESNLNIDNRNSPVKPVPAPRRNTYIRLGSPSPTARRRAPSPSVYYWGNNDRRYDRMTPQSLYTDYIPDQQYDHSRHKSIDIPKGLKRDGTSNWKTVYTKCQRYADRLSWSTTERKDKLCCCLGRKAGDFYTNLMDRDEYMDYFQLIHKLEKRFNYQDFPETLQIQCMSARQNQHERLEDWEDRVLSFACKAYRNLPDRYMYIQAIWKICQGSVDKEAGQHAATAKPSSMEAAIDHINWYQHNHRAIHVYMVNKRIDVSLHVMTSLVMTMM